MIAGSETFRAYMQFLLPAEGRHANDAEDRGGETWYGLSSRFLDSIGWETAPPTREEAIELYRAHFWLGRRCHEVAPVVAWCMADAYVQHPPRAAALMVQQGLGVDLDGIIGPNTIEAAQSPDIRLFWRRYSLARVRFYNDIVQSDPTQSSFIDGWHARLHKLAEGMFDAGLFGPPPDPAPKPSILRHENSKVAAAGTGLAGLVVLLFALAGVDVDSVPELLSSVGVPSALVGVIGSWLTKLRLRSS